MAKKRLNKSDAKEAYELLSLALSLQGMIYTFAERFEGNEKFSWICSKIEDAAFEMDTTWNNLDSVFTEIENKLKKNK